MTRHLLAAGDLDRETAIGILDTAAKLAVADSDSVERTVLRGRTMVNLFYENSTRTRVSFEVAAKRLSLNVINFSAAGSSVSKGESLKDTALTLQAMGADAVVVRHSAAGAARRLTEWLDAAVINAGDGWHEHPTQALLDAYTIRDRFGLHDGRVGQLGLAGLRVAIVGDILHSRVARSNIWLLHTLGAHVTLVAPPTLLPRGIEQVWPVSISHDFDAVLPELDVCMMLRVQAERMVSAYFPSVAEYVRDYGLDSRRFARLPGHAIVAHPGPMVRGMEISGDVADSPRATMTEQVANGVNVRAAVLHELLRGNGGHGDGVD